MKKGVIPLPNENPRGNGYRILHCVLIVLGTLIVLLALTGTIFMRHQLKYRSITNALTERVRLSDAKVPFQGKTVSEYIQSEYVKDSRVLNEDIAEAVDSMEIPVFIADKLSALGDLLRGTTDTVPSVTPDEIVGLLEEHEHDLYRKCMLVIEQSDKNEIRSELNEPLTSLNDTLNSAYGSAAMRGLARFRVSIWMVLLELALIGLLLWRRVKVARNCGQQDRDAFRAMGRTIMIPSAIVFFICVIAGLFALFAKDGVIGLNPLWKAIREPFWLSSMLGISGGALLIIIANLIDIREAKKQLAPAPVQRGNLRPEMESVSLPPRAANTKFCIYCGKSIPMNAGFCSYCGKKQTADPAPAIPEPETAPDTVAPDFTQPEAPAVPEVPVVPEIPAEPETPAFSDAQPETDSDPLNSLNNSDDSTPVM